MRTLLFLLEEPSARAMLESFLPRILPAEIEVFYIVFQGKSDMHKRLGKRIREWCKPDTKFVVLRDQDSANCMVVKQELRQICQKNGNAEALIRIACRELESWYLGDLMAVEKGLELSGLAKNQQKKNFRKPDELPNPAEELKRLTKYKYQKVSGSRRIGEFLTQQNNLSHSFRVFVNGLKQSLGRMPNT